MGSPREPGIVPHFSTGDRLRKAREIAGLSQAQLAADLGLARRTVISYESDAHAAKRSNVMAWALRTGVSFEWILQGSCAP